MLPDFVERQFIGEHGGADALIRQMGERMKALGITWAQVTVIPEKDQVVMEGWLVRPPVEP